MSTLLKKLFEDYVAQNNGSAASSGLIALDEEHDLGARITYERSEGGGGAITCGIYGWMMHTRYFILENEAREAFEAMKTDLEAILQRIPLRSDPDLESKMSASSDAMSAFVEKHP